MRRWRTILAGGALAAVGFVAAQAGSLDFLRFELAQLTKSTDDKPLAVQASTGAHRSYSTASAAREQPGMFVSASRAPAAAPAAALGSGSDGEQGTGETTVDGVDLFELSPAAMPTALAASNDPLKFGDRFRGLVDGAGSGSQRPPYGGSGGGRAQKGLVGCCDDPATPQSDALLTAPTLADGVSGPIPESRPWALMILGFGLSGVVLRGQRRRWA